MSEVAGPEPVIDVSELRRDFDGVHALNGVSLQVAAGEIHALLGPNGAGKTTLLRVLTGMVAPTSGTASVAGIDPADRRRLQRAVGFVPASDRSFYLRISARENLIFFGRLYGFRRRTAAAEAERVLEHVGLTEAADRRLYTFSHGMLKRLGVARALLTAPRALLVDEATHDLDPEAARNVRSLIEELAASGTAVLWTTQRVEEIRAFADRVTVLAGGIVRFNGTVPALLARARPQTFLLTVRNGGLRGSELAEAMQTVLGERASVTPAAGEEDGFGFRLSLSSGFSLGAAVATLDAHGLDVLGCRDEKPEVEEAFVLLTSEDGR